MKRERPKARIVTPAMLLAIVYSKVMVEHARRAIIRDGVGTIGSHEPVDKSRATPPRGVPVASSLADKGRRAEKEVQDV